MPNPSLNDIYDRMHDTEQTPSAHPATANLFTDWSLEAGDVVNMSQGANNYEVPIYVNKVKWQGAPTVEIESTGNKEREPIAKASQRASGGAGGVAQTKGMIQTIGEQILSIMPSICVISEDIVVMKGTLIAHDAQFSTISASVASIEGQLTASSIAAKLGTIEELYVNGLTVRDNLKVIGETTLQDGLNMAGAGISGVGHINADSLTASSVSSQEVSAGTLYAGEVMLEDTELSGAYVGTPTASASGSTITLFFTTAAGSTVSVNFNKAGDVITGVGLGALSNVRINPEEGVVIGDTHVNVYTSSGTKDQGTHTLEVTSAYNTGYAAGWAAARAQCSAYNGAAGVTLRRASATVDGGYEDMARVSARMAVADITGVRTGNNMTVTAVATMSLYTVGGGTVVADHSAQNSRSIPIS